MTLPVSLCSTTRQDVRPEQELKEIRALRVRYSFLPGSADYTEESRMAWEAMTHDFRLRD
jgi:hypothetical protein